MLFSSASDPHDEVEHLLPSPRTARRASAAASITLLLLVSLLLSGHVTAAVATGEPTPAQATATATATPSGPAPVAAPDATTLPAFSVRYIDVLANDTCAGVKPCKRAQLTGFSAVGPAGWGIAASTTSGFLRIRVPSGTLASTSYVRYTITDANGTSSTTVKVKVTLPPTPDHYNPPQGSKFSHAFVKGSLGRIRTHVLRTINSVPRGGQIRILSWSFSSPRLRKALYAAKRRGVSVQIIMSPPVDPTKSDYKRLFAFFGGQRYHKDGLRGSWVYQCKASCRGTGGTMHSKVFLFSQAYQTRWIVMSGSGNMTDYAADHQWNQQYTTTNDKTIYDSIVNKVFLTSKLDQPDRPRQLTLVFPTTTYYFTPMTARTTQYDFVYQALRNVTCTGADTRTGRTRIRISMYTWRDDRGDWMARQVRRLWNQGCDIRIIYAIMGNRNKAILYNPGGRGRIPMRQTILVDVDHRPVWYLHQKYIAIGGKIGANPKAFATYQGSFNFSDLGMRSDENFQKLNGYANYVPYVADFNQIWRQRETRAPDPNSYVLQAERLGTGRYSYMEPN